jgi:hypothetical protein
MFAIFFFIISWTDLSITLNCFLTYITTKSLESALMLSDIIWTSLLAIEINSFFTFSNSCLSLLLNKMFLKSVEVLPYEDWSKRD